MALLSESPLPELSEALGTMEQLPHPTPDDSVSCGGGGAGNVRVLCVHTAGKETHPH